MRSHKEIDDLFGDHRFSGQIMEHPWASTRNRHGDIIRLIIVVYPPTDMLCYRIEIGNDDSRLFSKFVDALRVFRELI